jgi:signal transduction histidine kinase
MAQSTLRSRSRSAGRRMPSVTRLGGAVVCVTAILSLVGDGHGVAVLSWTGAAAGLSALAGVAFFALCRGEVTGDADAPLYAGASAAMADAWGWPVWVVRVLVVVLAPLAGVGVALYAAGSLMAVLRNAGHAAPEIDWRSATGVALLGLAWVAAVRAAGLRVGSDGELYSVLLIGSGLPLFWGASGARPADGSPSENSELRTWLGLLLALGGAGLVLGSTGLFRQAEGTIAGTAIALAVLAFVVGPRWLRTTRLLIAERSARARAQERADLADHLHDSVLQTLALIQRRADDPAEVASLSRSQERELRSWLRQGPDAIGRSRSLAGALRAAAAAVEDAERAPVEVVIVGDASLAEPLAALVGATREALTNAIRHGSPPVSLFCRVSDREVTVYVHDRGPGFDIDGIPHDRRGVRESIIARTARHGGTAAVHVTADAGCEIVLTMALR